MIFSKGSRSNEVTSSGNGASVSFRDLILDDDVADADLVVLDLGMVPNSGPNPWPSPTNWKSIVQRAADKAEVEAKKRRSRSSRSSTSTTARAPTCRTWSTASPIRTSSASRTRRAAAGIYAAGPVRRPMDIKQAQDDATGAAMRRSRRRSTPARVRPRIRASATCPPEFRKEGCTQCKRCTVECPFGAINEDEKRYPQFNESRCRRCGTCMGACPVRVISFGNYSIDTVGQQIKNVDMPDEFSEKPRILVMA